MNRFSFFSVKNRSLLKELVLTDFKLRYQGSVLGYAWSLLKPLFLFGILFIVFDKFLGLGRGIENFAVYLLLGIVLWSFFTESTGQGRASIVRRGSLIRKINFPKYIVVVSSTVSSLINLALNLTVVFIFAFISGVDFTFNVILFPLLLIELYLFALAVSLILATMYVKYRDIGHIWDVVTQAGFYATPIIYPISIILQKSDLAAKLILLLNPMAQIIQDARYLIVSDSTITASSVLGGDQKYLIFIPYLIVLLTLLYSIHYFRKNAPYFAEMI